MKNELGSGMGVNSPTVGTGRIIHPRRSHSWHFAKVLALLGLCLLFASCKDDPEPPAAFDYENGVLVINEGNFQGGNASLTYIRRSDDSLRDDVFKLENERPLGDVAQSVTVIGDKAYIVVNNSAKIEVVDLPSFKSSCTITGLNSPRYMLPIGTNQALVSDLYADAIHVVNLSTCSRTSAIPVGGWTEQFAIWGNRAYVPQTGTDQLLVLDAVTPSLIDSITVGREPNSLGIDAHGKLWVLCGNALGQVTPRLVRVDVVTQQIVSDWPFSSPSQSPFRLCLNPAGDSLYFINEGIYRMSVLDTQLPSFPWIEKGSHNWYSLGVDPVTGHIYAGDALDFQRQGKVYRFSPNSSTALASFEVGLIPGGFCFLP
ncbi:MAG: hypothetical protein U0176_08505 [Bacteroidia bacterium]